MKRKEKIRKKKFNTSKTFSVIAFVLIVITLFGFTASLFGGSGSAGGGTVNVPNVKPNDKPNIPDDNPDVPETPEEDEEEDIESLVTVIPDMATPKIITEKTCAVHVPYSPSDNGISYLTNADGTPDGNVEILKDVGNSYFSIKLKDDPENPLVYLTDYDYVSIEFDITTTGNSPFKTAYQIIARDYPYGNASSLKGSVGKVYVDGGLIYGSNKDDSKQTDTTNNIHVKYEIAINEESNELDCYLYLNDECYYYSTEQIVPSNIGLDEIRFNSIKYLGQLSFTNLKVQGYIK